MHRKLLTFQQWDVQVEIPESDEGFRPLLTVKIFKESITYKLSAYNYCSVAIVWREVGIIIKYPDKS